MFKKVLILSAASGAGHIRAAQAVEKAFIDLNAAQTVIHADALEYTNRIFSHLYNQAYIDLVNGAPAALGWLYDALDKPWKNQRRRLAFDKLNTRKLVRLLTREQPDFVVCTHFLPSEILSWLKAKERLDTRQAIVVTDFDCHAMWLCPHYEHYFVALQETKLHLQSLGIRPDAVTVSGIPIDPVFAQSKDKVEMRKKYGLLPDLDTIMVSAGGLGVGPVDHVITSLSGLRHPSQILVMCGKNEELKQRVDAIAGGATGNARIHAVGFTREMDEYMSASDIIVGKPGGLTTSEALAKELVFCIVNPIPGQEERNSDHLLEQGAAIRCNNLPVLAHKIDALLYDVIRLTNMRKRASALGRPDSARTIVRELVARFGE